MGEDAYIVNICMMAVIVAVFAVQFVIIPLIRRYRNVG